MYVGIYLSERFITVVYSDSQDGSKAKKLFVKTKSGGQLPLQFYGQKDTLHLGEQLEQLLAYDPELTYCENLMSKITTSEEVLHIDDQDGFEWNAFGIFCAFLTHLKKLFKVRTKYDIQGAFLTSSIDLTPELNSALQQAFEVVEIPILKHITFEKSIVKGYKLPTPKKTTNAIFMDYGENTISFRNTVWTPDGAIKNSTIKRIDGIGFKTIQDKISEFILDRYELLTQTKLERKPKLMAQLEPIANGVVQAFFLSQKYAFDVFLGFLDPAIEFLVQRNEIKNELIIFLKNIQNHLLEFIKEQNIEMNQETKLFFNGHDLTVTAFKSYFSAVEGLKELEIHGKDAKDISVIGLYNYVRDYKTNPEMCMLSDSHDMVSFDPSEVLEFKSNYSKEKLSSKLRTAIINPELELSRKAR